MALEIRCPSCGEDDDLVGTRVANIITIACGRCQAEWVRDLDARPTCPACDSDDVREAVRAVVEKSRGTQLSIQSFTQVWLCPTCDYDDYEQWKISNRPLNPPELPTT